MVMRKTLYVGLTLVLILLMCRNLASHLEAYASEGLALYWCTKEAI